MALACAPAAAFDYNGSSSQIRPAVVNAGGRGDLSSASQQLADGLGEIGLSSFTSAGYQLLPSFIWTFHKPGTVTDLAASALGTSSATLRWSAPALDGGLGQLTAGVRYYVQYSTYSSPVPWDFESAQIIVSTAGVSLGDVQSRIAAGLNSGATYYFRLWTIDFNAGLSEPSNAATATLMGIPRDSLPPAEVNGFAAALSTDASRVTLSWSPVTTNNDGTPITDLAVYRILRSPLLGGATDFMVDLTAPATLYRDVVNGGVFYYQIVALDVSGNPSPRSHYVTSEAAPRSFFLGDSGMVKLNQSGTSRLLGGNNATGRDLRVEMTRRTEHELGATIRSFFVDLVDAQSGQSVPTSLFGGDSLGLTFSYGTSTSVPLALLSRPAGGGAVAIYYSNGAHFVIAGGLDDAGSKLISLTTPNFGAYQIRTVSDSGFYFDASQVRPRVITPNGDGKNDFAVFFFDNPGQAVVRLRIIDVNGGQVAEVTRPGPFPGNSLAWDGRDGSGRKVPPGVFVYVLEAENRRFSGTVVVAR